MKVSVMNVKEKTFQTVENVIRIEVGENSTKLIKNKENYILRKGEFEISSVHSNYIGGIRK